MTVVLYWFPFLGLIGLAVAGLIYLSIKRIQVKNETMVEISDAIHSGAMVFLRREYLILVFFVLFVFALTTWAISLQTGIAFLCGAICSMSAGFFAIGERTKPSVTCGWPPGVPSTTVCWRDSRGWGLQKWKLSSRADHAGNAVRGRGFAGTRQKLRLPVLRCLRRLPIATASSAQFRRPVPIPGASNRIAS